MASRGRPKHPDILTPREWDVLALIRENLTNDQIAQRLGIGAEGAKYHVSEILSKLGLSSREEAAAWDPRQRPDWTPHWDPTRRPAWATALAPLGLFWRRLTGGLARSAGSLATVTSVVLGVGVVAAITILAVLLLREDGSSNDTGPAPPAVAGQSTSAASATPPAVVDQSTAQAGPAATGKIAFMSNRDGNQEIYVMNADGSGQANLTNNPGDDPFGAWAPDGSRIAFVSERDGNWEIYAVNADGSRLTNLTQDPGDDGVVGDDFNGGWGTPLVAWSPDGSRIAFMSDRDGNGEIYVMAADGSGQTNLTNNNPWSDNQPAWSPDGSRIAFSSDRDGNQEIYVMAADGSGQTNLTDNPLVDVDPAGSPDSSRIVFHSGGDPAGNIGNLAVYVMNADGSGLTDFTGDVHNFRAWAPDGSRIAFTSERDNNWEIYVANADGSGLTNLTQDPGLDLMPAWSPDGSRIAFNSGRNANSDVYVMNADGSGLTNLTNNPGVDYDPVWSPVP